MANTSDNNRQATGGGGDDPTNALSFANVIGSSSGSVNREEIPQQGPGISADGSKYRHGLHICNGRPMRLCNLFVGYIKKR